MRTKEEPTIDYVHGNPVLHFLAIQETDWTNGQDTISIAYDEAVEKSKPFGGFRVHCHSYGGGIGFPSKLELMNCFEHFSKEAGA